MSHFRYSQRGKLSLYNHSRQQQEKYSDVVIGMIKVFMFYVYVLLEPGKSLSFVTPYVANQFEILPEKHNETFSIFRPIGESMSLP